MKIGIIGDTHDNLPLISRVVDILSREHVDLVLHTGDYIAPFVIPLLGKIPARIVGVFGNNDGDRELLLTRSLEQSNINLAGYFTALILDGEKIALLHGHDRSLLAHCLECGEYDIVVHGHTHKPSIQLLESTIDINPGEVCGYLTGNPTYAMYHTKKKDARIVSL